MELANKRLWWEFKRTEPPIENNQTALMTTALGTLLQHFNLLRMVPQLRRLGFWFGLSRYFSTATRTYRLPTRTSDYRHFLYCLSALKSGLDRVGEKTLTEFLTLLRGPEHPFANIVPPKFVDGFVLTLVLSGHSRVYSPPEISELLNHHVRYSRMVWGMVRRTGLTEYANLLIC